MKRLGLVLLSVLLGLLSLIGCQSVDQPTPDIENTNVVKIGVFEPSSGNSASGGKKEILGISYANREIPTVNINGTTYDVELVIVDNGSEKETAIAAANELVDSGVSVVIGSYGSYVSLAASHVFAKAGIPVIGASCTHPKITQQNDNYFRICIVDSLQATMLSDFAVEKFSAKKAYMLGEVGNEYDQGLMAYFEDNFKELGGEVKKDSFPKNNSDFTAYLNKAIEYEADVVFLPVSIAYATQILLQADSLNLDIPFLGADTLDDNKILDSLKESDISLYTSTLYNKGGDKVFDEKITEYINSNEDAKALNGGNDVISGVTAMGYDAYQLAIKAIEAAASVDSNKIKAAIPTIDFLGVAGIIEFDASGLNAKRSVGFINYADTEAGAWAFEKRQHISGFLTPALDASITKITESTQQG